MPETKLDPSQIKDMAELLERLDQLEAESAALRCAFKGSQADYAGAKRGNVAFEEADKLPEPKREKVKRLLMYLYNRE